MRALSSMPNVFLSGQFSHMSLINQLYLLCGKVREKEIQFIFLIVE